MPGPRIKICGITTAAALDAAVAARAEFIGLVFHPPSPRHLTPSEAAPLAARAEGRIARVGLFVDADVGAIRDAVAAARLDALQLHGDETPARVAELSARYGLPVWKALAVSSAADVAGAARYAGVADLILFDAKAPKGAAAPGGLGLVFDWTLLAGHRAATAWGLAGGLSPDNVGEAVRVTGAPLVDVSSGVEKEPGVKDVDRIAAFCKAARR
jgi:phosphoribosylanthranilate isomerase